MSRLGKQPIDLPEGVKVLLNDSLVKVEGPKGKLDFNVPYGVKISQKDKQVVVERINNSADARARHGLARQLISNMVHGVSTGFSRTLEIKGVGYRAQAKGRELGLTLGLSHPVNFPLPESVTAKVEGNTTVILESPDKALLGDVAAKIRSLRPPEPYQGKGIKYAEETIRRKAGKAAAGGK
ncbi:50S ribosomal protein L6 [bacterium]|nr:50S ribosomal protein L6 [bacterium]